MKDSSKSNKIFSRLGILYLICFIPFYFWCVNWVDSYISGWGFLFTLGIPLYILAIPGFLMIKALDNKDSYTVIDSMLVNILYGALFNHLSSVPYLNDGTFEYEFSLRFLGLAGLIFCIMIGIVMALMLGELSKERSKLIAKIGLIGGGFLVLGLSVITAVQWHSQSIIENVRYNKSIKSSENSELSSLTDYVSGVHKVEFAIVPANKFSLSDLHNTHPDTPIVRINEKKISSDDYNYLTNQEDENEPFSKRQALAAKYGLTMRKHGKPARQSLKQVKKTEVDWTEKQIDKYQDAY